MTGENDATTGEQHDDSDHEFTRWAMLAGFGRSVLAARADTATRDTRARGWVGTADCPVERVYTTAVVDDVAGGTGLTGTALAVDRGRSRRPTHASMSRTTRRPSTARLPSARTVRG